MRTQVTEDARQRLFGIRAEEPRAGPYLATKRLPGFAEVPVVRPPLLVKGIATVRVLLAVLDVPVAVVVRQQRRHVGGDLFAYARHVGNHVRHRVAGPLPQALLGQGVLVAARLAGGEFKVRLQDLVDAIGQITQRQRLVHSPTMGACGARSFRAHVFGQKRIADAVMADVSGIVVSRGHPRRLLGNSCAGGIHQPRPAWYKR